MVVEYIYYSNEVYTNKLVLYCIYAIFHEEFFSKYNDSYVKECKLYNKLLNKISSETKLLVSGPSRKNRPTSILILHISIPSIQNNPPYFPSSFLSYKFLSLLPFQVPKKPIVEIKEADNVNSDIEMQSLSP